jgi:hypothetical protein
MLARSSPSHVLASHHDNASEGTNSISGVKAGWLEGASKLGMSSRTSRMMLPYLMKREGDQGHGALRSFFGVQQWQSRPLGHHDEESEQHNSVC